MRSSVVYPSCSLIGSKNTSTSTLLSITPQQNRMISSSSTGGEDSVSSTHSSPVTSSALSDDGNKQQPSQQLFGVNNFRKMLQYQQQPDRPDTPRNNTNNRHRGNNNNYNNNNNGGGGRSDIRARFADANHQNDDDVSTKNNSNNNNYDTFANRKFRNQSHHQQHINNDDIPKERPRWRNGRRGNNQRNKTRKQQQQHHKEKEDKRLTSRPKPIAQSDWIEISNTPPSSKLSDIYPSLNQIIQYELSKGIIDLDALGGSSNNLYSLDDVTTSALREVDALDTMYSTQHIANDGIIPLWTPSSTTTGDDNNYLDSYYLQDVAAMNNNEECPMILEARIHLSYRARPFGWFIRLPNRSVVNAVLNHVKRARYSWNDVNLKEQRKGWREGLWRGVYDEYKRKADDECEMKANEILVKVEGHGEKELMWGDGFEEEEDNEEVPQEVDSVSLEESNLEERAEDMIQASTVDGGEEEQDNVDDYLAKYSETYPFPSQLAPPPTINNENQLLKVGSTKLKIREFIPYPSDVSFGSASEYTSWEQYAFYLSPMLNLSDSVIRVESADLRISKKDIQYLFRGYDMETILPQPTKDDSGAVVSASLTDFPESRLGWNVDWKGNNNNVDFIVKGKTLGELRYDLKQTGHPIHANRHSFLVRFATPADARMAVRDTDGQPIRRGKGDPSQQGPPLRVTQYPAVVNHVE